LEDQITIESSWRAHDKPAKPARAVRKFAIDAGRFGRRTAKQKLSHRFFFCVDFLVVLVVIVIVVVVVDVVGNVEVLLR
jgi:hypothetical protein